MKSLLYSYDRWTKITKIITLISPCSGFVILSGLAAVLILMSVDQVRSDDTLCEGKEHNTLLPNENDCKSFFLCRDGLTVAETCSVSFWFDPTRLVCALPGPYCKELICFNKTGIFADDPVCGVWHYCLNGDVANSDTCVDDLSFDPESQTCTYPKCAEIIKESVEDNDILPPPGIIPFRSG